MRSFAASDTGARFLHRFSPLAWYFFAILFMILPSIVILNEREARAVRDDAGMRADLLARAVWLRLVDARREIPGVLLRSNWQAGPAIFWRSLPWFDKSVRLFPRDGPSPIPPSGGDERSPLWLLSTLTQGVYQARVDSETQGGWQPVIGLDAVITGQPDGRELQRRGLQSGQVSSLPDARIFFERQRRIDALANEIDILLPVIDKGKNGLSVLIASDGASVYARSLGMTLPKLADIPKPAPEGWVRVVVGGGEISGAVLVDLRHDAAPSVSELVLLVLPALIISLAVFLALRRSPSSRQILLFLVLTAVISGALLWVDVSQRQEARSRHLFETEESILAAHQRSEAVIALAAPELWRDFPFLDNRGLKTAGSASLILFLFLSLLPGIGLAVILRGLVDRGGRISLAVPGILVMLLVGTIFLASLVKTFPEHGLISQTEHLHLVVRLIFALVIQTLLAIPLVFAWAHFGRMLRTCMLAILFLPLVIPIEYTSFLIAFTGLSQVSNSFVSVFAGLPLIVLAMIMSRSRIPLSVRKALALECSSAWHRYRSLDLVVCLVGAVPAWAASAWFVLSRASATEKPILPLEIILSLLLLGIAVRMTPLWMRSGGPMEGL